MIVFPSQKNFIPSQVYLEESVVAEPLTRRVLAHLPGVPCETIPSLDALWYRSLPGGALLLARQRGPFLRYCPGTPRHICCLYQNLDVAAGCDLGCSYCILQGYLNTPGITFYVNLENLFTEVQQTLIAQPNEFFRMGTGELSDSLTFDHLTGLSVELVNFFAKHTNAVIELKTKNVHIDHLLPLQHNRRTIVSWSVNAEPVCQSEEPDAPRLQDRLAAAEVVQQAGYRLGFHFDPMIWFDGWQAYYRETVDKIFSFCRPENIAWISLGALRYPAAMDDLIRRLHPQSKIVLGELLPGVDKKLRYFKSLRIEMFRHMVEWIKSYGYEDGVYLCMESDEVWRKSFGWSPANSAGLKKILDDRVR